MPAYLWATTRDCPYVITFFIMVFYRKYRPQTIDELDSEKVRQTLSSVLVSKEIPHAFLERAPACYPTILELDRLQDDSFQLE